MNDIEIQVNEILGDSNRWKGLLRLEKRRRGVPQEALVFVGMANVASHWWCTQKAVFTSRASELDLFAAYLLDRIVYAHRLGLVMHLPRSDDALLDVGKEITLADVQNLLKAEQHKVEERASHFAGDHATWLCQESMDIDDKRSRLINQDLPAGKKEYCEDLAAVGGVRVIGLDNPKRRGMIYHVSRAYKYPTIRWNFTWGPYQVVGEPDGITDDSVYEYKTTRNWFLFKFRKPVAFAQADLYGYFFHRPKKRVQIDIIEDGSCETFEQPVDAENAQRTLADFARVELGDPAHPPKAWKCRGCEFQTTCPIGRAK
jgi:hypothetical protein